MNQIIQLFDLEHPVADVDASVPLSAGSVAAVPRRGGLNEHTLRAVVLIEHQIVGIEGGMHRVGVIEIRAPSQ